jgi:DNA-binding NtrC family response regulator
MKKLIAYNWPGNVRELQNIIKSFMVIGNWDKIIADLYLKSQSFAISRSEEQVLEGSSIVDVLFGFKDEYSSDHASFSLKKITKKAIDRREKEVISFVLDKTGWNRKKASEILKINYRTLLYKISGLSIKSQYLL